MATPFGFEFEQARRRSVARGFRNTLRLIIFKTLIFLSHGTPLKLANLAMAYIQKWFKRDRVWGMPYRYVIDPINVCNLRCPLCPTGLGTLGRDRGKLDPNRFKDLVDQIAPFAFVIELYNWGEPFLHPNIFDMITYASKKRISVRLSTNLNHFDHGMAAKTVASGLDAMIVSVDGVKQETYEKYRRRGKLDVVLENIRILVAEKRKAGSRTPIITMRMLINRYNEHEISQMRALAESLGVDAFTTFVTFVDTSNPEQIKEWLPENQSLSYYDYSAPELENVWACADLWESMTINWDGGVAPCCWLHQNKHDYTNAFTKTIKEIWNGPEYISSRRVFAFGGPKPGPVKTICTVCKGRPRYLKD